jgi:hypothetical protein
MDAELAKMDQYLSTESSFLHLHSRDDLRMARPNREAFFAWYLYSTSTERILSGAMHICTRTVCGFPLGHVCTKSTRPVSHLHPHNHVFRAILFLLRRSHFGGVVPGLTYRRCPTDCVLRPVSFRLGRLHFGRVVAGLTDRIGPAERGL